ncbi:MAG: homoserine dehydrogenase [Hyphomicrobiaceae bacterium]|nr:homoserine dehydrogenase [Hyphomicrobiaceae bacterium]
MATGRLPLAEALEAAERRGRPVRVGIIGAGQMGTDLLVQIALMPGMDVVAHCDSKPERIAVGAGIAGARCRRPDIVSTPGEVTAAIARGRIAAVTSPELVCEADDVDVVIDATGNPNAGARVALTAIGASKHIIMMNVEADVTVGAYLADAARRAGVVYSIGAGDEPTSTMELIRFVRALGYPVVAAGKGKNNAFNVDATPDDHREEALRRNMNPRMLVEFVDGTKTMVEMVAIANATGLVPDVPGMHGPVAPRAELQNYFCPKEDGGVLSKKGCVDFSLAKDVAPGVFCIAEMAHPRLRERMNDLHLGPGPYYTFYRPYHLTSLEVPLSAAAAAIHHESHMHALAKPVAEVACMAKCALKPGDVLGRIGEYFYRGYALTRPDARARRALPIGLAQGARIVKPVEKGSVITWDAVELPEGSHIARVRRLQDEMIGD